MNHLPSKTINGLLTNSSFYNATRGIQRTSRIHTSRIGTSRLKSTRTEVQPAKKDALPPNAGKKENPKVALSSARRVSSDSIQEKEGPNDKPLPYQNTPSVWTSSSFLTPYMRKYPALYKGLKFFYDGLGLYAKQGDSVRLGKKAYMGCCERDIIEEAFVYDACGIPRTFHTWFQLTNLHVWLLTVRLRALPPPYGRLTLQALVDFFFQDIEDRLRSLLGPRIPERTIKSYMEEYRELWNGSTLALDIGLVGGDWELGGAIWRNCFDAHGWDLGGPRGEDGQLVGRPGEVGGAAAAAAAAVQQTSSQALSASALGSGNVGAPTSGSAQNAEKALVEIPLHVHSLVAYLRRELKRLEDVPDDMIIERMDLGEWGRMEGTKYGDNVKNGPVSREEKERWENAWEGIGTYR